MRVAFRKTYTQFGDELKPFEKADDVGLVVAQFMWRDGKPFYPVGSLANATVSALSLCAPGSERDDDDNLDLIFKMRAANGGHYFEIVLRSELGTFYGGCAWGQTLEVEKEAIAGYHVLVAKSEVSDRRYLFDPALRRYRSEQAQTHTRGPTDRKLWIIRHPQA